MECKITRMNKLLDAVQTVLSRVLETWRGKLALGAIVFLSILVVAFFSPIRKGMQEDSPSNEKPFWFTSCEGPAFRDVRKEPGYGDSRVGMIVRVTNELILAPPANVFPHYLGYDPKGPLCKQIEDLPRVTMASFTMRASTLRGPDPSSIRKSTFDPDLVTVQVMAGVQITAGDPATAEVAAIERYSKDKLQGRPVEQKDEYGLRCYGYPTVAMTCFGSSAGGLSPDVALTVNMLMSQGLHAAYVTPKYGRVEIAWLTGNDTLFRWKEIAHQVFLDLDTWNALREG